MKQKIITVILASCICLQLLAQHEFSINFGGGISTFDYKPAGGKYTYGYGGEAGLGYNFFFTPNWSLGTGVNLAMYNSETTMNDYSRTINQQSVTGKLLRFSYTLSNYHEDISAMMLNIPLMLRFQTGGKIALYVAGGAKVGIPLSAEYEASRNISTNGYMPDYGVTYYGLPNEGFGDYQGVTHKDDVELKLCFMVSGELGVKWRLSNAMNLYTGGYIDYGINNIKKGGTSKEMLGYNNNRIAHFPENFSHSSMINSMNDNIIPFAVGLKIRLSYDFNKK